MLAQTIPTVQQLGDQVNMISGRVIGAGNFDDIRVTLADLELKVSEYRNLPTRGGKEGCTSSTPRT